MLSWIFMDFVFQYYHKAHKNIAFSIENSLPQLAAKFFPQKGANLKSKKAHCVLNPSIALQIPDEVILTFDIQRQQFQFSSFRGNVRDRFKIQDTGAETRRIKRKLLL